MIFAVQFERPRGTISCKRTVRLATTQKGRRRVSQIYQKLRFPQDDPGKENTRRSRLNYDKDGKGDERFLEALLLMLREGHNNNSAARKVVGPNDQNAFHISLGTCSFLMTDFVYNCQKELIPFDCLFLKYLFSLIGNLFF